MCVVGEMWVGDVGGECLCVVSPEALLEWEGYCVC